MPPLHASLLSLPAMHCESVQMVGIWSVLQWQQLGCPPQLNLVEMGPGRGTLMADLLRGTKTLQPFSSAVHVHLVEVQPDFPAHNSSGSSLRIVIALHCILIG